MNALLASGGFSWFKLIGLPETVNMPDIEVGGMNLGGPVVMDPVYHSIFVVLLLAVLGLAARKALTGRPQGADGLVPEDKLTSRSFFEIFVEGMYNFLEPMLGSHTRTFFPLLATLFLYILVCNVLGLVPGFQIATADINSNIGMAVTVFLIYNIAGMAENGVVNYLKHFMGPVLVLAPLMVIVELVSHISRPLSLSVRLFGNMSGDHAVFETFMEMTHGILIPVIFLGLGLLVCIIQALVFTLLSTAYLSLALAHEEGAH